MKYFLNLTSFLFILFSFFSLNNVFALIGDEGGVNNPYSGISGGLNQGITDVKNGIDNIEKDKKFSEYIQDIVIYVIGFVTLIAVLYIIYAGFVLLVGVGDEEKAKKTKGIISYVIIGIVLIWLSYPITTFIIGVFT